MLLPETDDQRNFLALNSYIRKKKRNVLNSYAKLVLSQAGMGKKIKNKINKRKVIIMLKFGSSGKETQDGIRSVCNLLRQIP